MWLIRLPIHWRQVARVIETHGPRKNVTLTFVALSYFGRLNLAFMADRAAVDRWLQRAPRQASALRTGGEPLSRLTQAQVACSRSLWKTTTLTESSATE